MDAALAAAPPRARPHSTPPLQQGSLALAVLLHALLLLAFLWQWPLQTPRALSPVDLPRDVIDVIVVSRASPRPEAAPSTTAPTPEAKARKAEPIPAPPRTESTRPKPEPLEPRELSELSTPRETEPKPVPESRQPESASPSPTTAEQSARDRRLSNAAPAPADTQRPSRATEVRPFPVGYLRIISRRISQNLHYPSWSRRFKEQGTIIVRLRIARDGHVISADVVRGSASQYLDAEARDVMYRIARFPRVPADVYPEQSDFLIDQPVRFRLE